MKIVYDLLANLGPLLNFNEWKKDPSGGKNLVFNLLQSFGQLMKGPHCGNVTVRSFLGQLEPIFQYLATTEVASINTKKVMYEATKAIFDFMCKNTGIGIINGRHKYRKNLESGYESGDDNSDDNDEVLTNFEEVLEDEGGDSGGGQNPSGDDPPEDDES
jgi:hypothetical protein